MKTVGLVIMFASLLIATANAEDSFSTPAKDTPGPSVSNLDKKALGEWLLDAEHAGLAQGVDHRIILSAGDEDPFCATMRTYRMKRESRDSDSVRRSGYTTCVPMTRFRIETSAKPKPQGEDGPRLQPE